MAINFPNSPANGDTHTAAGTTYVYDATNSVWKRQGSSGGFDPASVSESLIPDANETYDLGSSTNKFRDLYLSGNSITLGTVELSDNGGALEVTPTGGGSAEPFATETYVTTQVNNLVDAAPGALDTLNELAAALGDDAAFSTTVTNSLATKADTSSLATVATSGSYNDLSNTPTIPNSVDISGKQDKLVGFNISSASYTAATQVYSQDNTPMGMVVNPAGTTLLMFGWQNDRIYEYSMSTAWDVSTLTYTNRSHDISNDSGFISNLVYNNDGTKLFATDQSSDLIIQMDLGTPYQLNSITATTPQNTNTQLSNSISSPQDVEWYDNGNKAIFVNGSRIYKVDAGAAYTVGGPNLTTPDSNYVDLHNSPPNSGGIIKLGLAQDSSDPSNHSVRGIKFNNDGTELHVLAQVISSGGETVIYVLDLSTPYDIYTATVDFSKKKIFDLYHSNATSFAFKPDGTKLFMLERGSANGGTTNAVYEYKTGGQLIDIVNSKSDFDGQYSSLTGAPTLATVATSGSYNDLTNQPTIPSTSGLATETYVNTQVSNLVDSAPATLDTLNELAAALGDDANFSTTITNQIAAKADAYSIATVTASGGNFYIDGVQQVTLSFEPGRTYRFDQADSSNSSHPLRFSTTSDGTHGGGSEYTTGVTTNGTAGSAGAYVQIAITNATPTLYYYCVNHGGMGAGTVVGNFSGAYSDLTGAPSIPSAYTDSAVDTHLNQSSATTGQILSWNGTDYAWIDAAAGGGSSVSVSSTAPSSPSEGDLWFDEDDLVMYVWYTDGDSSQWIEANSVTAAAATIHASDTAPTGPSSGDLWFNTTLLDLYVYYADGDSNQWVQVGGAANSQTSGSGGGSSVQSLIETANTSVTTTDTGTDGHIDFTTNGTLRWEIDSNGHILPHSNASFDIGSAEKKVRYLFLDSNTMFVGDTSFSEDNIDRSMEVYTDQPAPSSSTDEGKKGDVRIVGNYMYVCINTNEWIRTQIEKDW